MPFVNAGVEGATTKKALKEAVARGDRVWAYCTSPLGPQYNGYLDELPEYITLSVVGPDPYKSRRWYASVIRSNGKITVK